jgi:GAF domain-containing protein
MKEVQRNVHANKTGVVYMINLRPRGAACLPDSATIANAANLHLSSLPRSHRYLLTRWRLVRSRPPWRIAIGKGVCGTAAARRETVLVDDVHEFPGHIACDSASNSEIVVPLVKEDRLIGVLDLDSPSFARFHEEDVRGLNELAGILLDTLA